MENKHQIAQHNILYHQQKRNYSLTMNQFGDLLQHEFSGKYSKAQMIQNIMLKNHFL